MSDSKKGSKAPGSEYWGRRNITKRCDSQGTEGKRFGIQRERATYKKELLTLLKQSKENHPADDEDYGYNHGLDEAIRVVKNSS